MNENDDLLGFLVEGLIAPQRDLVTRAFYLRVQGDPNSGPVNDAVLLTAFSRRVALVPRELKEANVEFSKLLAGGREMEARIRERVELSNAGVVADFKDETRRANSALRETFRYAKDAEESAKETIMESRAILVEMRMLANDLTRLRQDLKIRDDSHEKIVESVQNIEAACQGTHDTVQHLTKECRANWTTVGFFFGILMTDIAFHFPWWEGLLMLLATIGLIQWLSRQSWDFVRRWIENWKSSCAKSKPAG